jgi:hypothetical protein
MLTIRRLITPVRRSLALCWIGSERTPGIQPRHPTRSRFPCADPAQRPARLATFLSENGASSWSEGDRNGAVGDRATTKAFCGGRRGGGPCLESFWPEVAGESARPPRYIAGFLSLPSHPCYRSGPREVWLAP